MLSDIVYLTVRQKLTGSYTESNKKLNKNKLKINRCA